MLKYLTILFCALAPSLYAKPIVLSNAHIRATWEHTNTTCQLVRIERTDRSDRLALQTDPFEILTFDGQRITANQYRVTSARTANGKTLELEYSAKPDAPGAPPTVQLRYTLGDQPWLHKELFIPLAPGDQIDRLHVLRFSCPVPAERGGFGQPVFIGKWFFGVDYPGFYSQHSNNFQEPDFRYKWFYKIDLEGRDRELAPRDGLVSFYHFPGEAREQPDGRHGVAGKRAVIGLSRKPGDSAELGLFDYIAATRKPPRSNLHFNNWFSYDAKAITVDAFCNQVGRTVYEKLAKYGAHLDHMVPDHGWQDGKSFDKIYQPQVNDTHDPLPDIKQALVRIGTDLGIWIALDGTNNSIPRGEEVGYRCAYAPGFERSERWMQLKPYFDLSQPKYYQDIKDALTYLIKDAGVTYIKHDLNHVFTSHGLTQRHARERCLDLTLELLAHERRLNPDIYQNYTNGSWFSPWWLQHVDTLWMMSGDSGGQGAWPQLSLRGGATSYRDSWLYQSFNHPDRCPRPILAIANFMTHGVMLSQRKPVTDCTDTLLDWSDYVMMYFARGTLVKELYLSIEYLDEDYWKVLGRAAAWAQNNQHRLINTVYVGGDPARGQAHGYISWVDGRALLTVRNPDRAKQTLNVPFDAAVYYRGAPGKPYHARAIYPFVETMPWRLVSGEAFTVEVPGDSVVVYELEPGETEAKAVIAAPPLPEASHTLAESEFTIELIVPDEPMPRYDLLIQSWSPARAQLVIDGEAVQTNRFQSYAKWTLSSYDLRDLRGKTLEISVHLVPYGDTPPGPSTKVEAWVVADRPVTVPAVGDSNLPFPIGQHVRRVTRLVLPKSNIKIVSKSGPNPAK